MNNKDPKIIYLSNSFPLFWLGAMAVTISPYIFISKDYINQVPNSGTIEHESVHLEQQNDYKWGKLAWFISYTFLPSFRLSQELAAYKAEYDFLVSKRNLDPKVVKDWISNVLSSSTYLKMISKENATRILNTWK